MNRRVKILSSIALAGVISLTGMSTTMCASKISSKDILNAIEGKRIVAYILDNISDVLTAKDLIESWNITNIREKNVKEVSLNTIISTGDTFTTFGDCVYTTVIYGDVNGDGKVNVLDAHKILKYSAEMLEEGQMTDVQLLAADVANTGNNAGIVNALDARRILRYSAEMEDCKVIVAQNPNESQNNLEEIDRNDAVSVAKSILANKGYSHYELINQLRSRGFTQEKAEYGADNCGANWNEQAVRKAREYAELEFYYSHKKILNFLESVSKFTHEEAVYGIENCEVDWCEQAVRRAEYSVSLYSSFELIEQLENEGFTHDEAVYGATNCNVNWNEQAVKKANYLLKKSSKGCSRYSLRKKLKESNFKDEEIEYGMNNCTVDWYNEALKIAENYMSFSNLSYEDLVNQLEFAEFTHEEAIYGADNCGIEWN